MRDTSALDRRSFVTAVGSVLAMPAIVGAGGARRSDGTVVETANGKLRGIRANGALSFKGIPYAADTGGANRFMAPRPAESWTGIREAFKFGDRCAQENEGGAIRTNGNDWFSWYATDATYSENCCVLNVFTRDLSQGAKRPVMVYIHGGGFRSGGGDGPALDGSNLATRGDVVVVTVNHRLNLFGYLQLGHLDPDFADAANVGQLDLIAALHWIRTNIAAFGGDPNRVLLFGQSGGGSKIATLMIMPGAKGLLHRAVNMSGTTAYSIGTGAAREPITNAFLGELGLGKGDIRKLQSLPSQQLLAAYRQTVRNLKGDDYRPVIDGKNIPYGPLTAQGIAVHASVPMIMGTAETEATLWLGRDRRNATVTADQVRRRIKAQFSLDDGKVDALYSAYQSEDPVGQPYDILCALSTDVLFRGRMLVGAEAKSEARKAPTYLYNFGWKVPVDGGIWKSPHASDIPFAFGNVDRARVMTGPGPIPDQVSTSLMSSFVAFARTGNPNNPFVPRWAPYEKTKRETMVVRAPCSLISDFHGTGRKASQPLLAQEAYQITGGPLFRFEG